MVADSKNTYSKTVKEGLISAVATYILWGAFPIYWKQLEQVSSIDVLCCRIVWAFCFMVPPILTIKSWRQTFFSEAAAIFRSQKQLSAVATAAFLITANWFTYIYAVSHNMIMESSLGYFINPLLNVALAVIFLKERLSRSGTLACLLALAGVVFVTVQAGVAPWISLAMALTFAFYGLLKKGMVMKPYTTLTIETFLTLPFAAIYLLSFAETPVFSHGPYLNALLVLAGVVTAVPLLLFAYATTRITYIVLGFTQYLSPTISFFIAFIIYHEPLPLLKLCGFILIWAGIAIYSVDVLQKRKGGSHT